MNCVSKLHKSKVARVGKGPKTNIFWKPQFYIFLLLYQSFLPWATFALKWRPLPPRKFILFCLCGVVLVMLMVKVVIRKSRCCWTEIIGNLYWRSMYTTDCMENVKVFWRKYFDATFWFWLSYRCNVSNLYLRSHRRWQLFKTSQTFISHGKR